MTDHNKIAFLCHPYHRGGVTRWMADAATAFAECGKNVYFVTVEPVKEFFSARGRETLLQLLAAQKSKAHIISAKAGYEFEFGTPEYRSFVYKKLLAQLPTGTPVIVSDDAAVWEAAAYLHATYPLIGVLHSDEATYYNLAVKYQQQASFYACVSGRVHRTLQGMMPGYEATHIATIPCGIDMQAFSPGTEHNEILNVVYAGRLTDYQKKAGDLVPVCEALVKNGTPFHLHIIGDGELRTPMAHNFIATGLSEHITFYGWLPQQEVAALLATSDILVLTSTSEGMPIAMMEALASGCGVVGTRVSGIEDYEHHALAAACFRVYTSGDATEGASKIKNLSLVARQARQHAARNLATAEFSMDICLARYEQAIHTIDTVPEQIREIKLSGLQRMYSGILALARNIKVRLLHR